MSGVVCLARSAASGSDASGLTPPVGDDGFLQHVAEGVDLQRERVRGAWVVGVALVVVVDRLAGVGEEDGMTVAVRGAAAAGR